MWLKKKKLLDMYVRKFRDAELSIYNYFEPRTCPKVRLRRMHFLGRDNTARKLLNFCVLLSKFIENEAACCYGSAMQAFTCLIWAQYD